jgi:peptide chain release factor 1
MDDAVRAKLEELVEAFAEVERQLSDPELLSDQEKYTETAQRHAELRSIIDGYQRFQQAETDASEAAELAGAEDDDDMAAEFRAMAAERRAESERIEEELWLALAPKDPNDDKDVIIEIRAAAGGDEAAIWAGDLMRMFERFAERRGYRSEVIEASPSEAGGYSKVSLGVKGRGAFSAFKYESGVHRVQRVPKTESQGRIHTSTATVAVLPEVEAVEVDLDLNDVRVDVYRSSGPGGQSVNTTDSAVRLTHEPTGITVACQDEKSQLQNKEKAFRILRARLYAVEMEKQQAELSAARLSQIGSGDRSEKIRTYNYKENRVTDHRIGLTIKQLPSILEGELDEFVARLTAEDQAARLAEDA